MTATKKGKSWCVSDFAIVPKALFMNKEINDRAVRIFGIIAGHARRDIGQAHLLRATIAEEAGVSLRTVTRAIADLKEAGFLEVRETLGASWFYLKAGPDYKVPKFVQQEPLDEGWSWAEANKPENFEYISGLPLAMEKLAAGFIEEFEDGTFNPDSKRRLELAMQKEFLTAETAAKVRNILLQIRQDELENDIG